MQPKFWQVFCQGRSETECILALTKGQLKLFLCLWEKESVRSLLLLNRQNYLLLNLFNQSPINGQTYSPPQCIFHFKEDGDVAFTEQSSLSGAADTHLRLFPLQIFQGSGIFRPFVLQVILLFLIHIQFYGSACA